MRTRHDGSSSDEVEPLGAVWSFPITLRMNLWLF